MDNRKKTLVELSQELGQARDKLFLEICKALYIDKVVEWLSNKLNSFSRKK